VKYPFKTAVVEGAKQDHWIPKPTISNKAMGNNRNTDELRKRRKYKHKSMDENIR